MCVTNYRGRWAIDIRFNGIRYRKNSPINTKAGAKAYEANVLQQFLIGKNPFKSEEKKIVLGFGEFAWKWINIYAKSNNKISEVKGKTSTLRTHLIPFFANKKLDKITGIDIEEYKSLIKDKGLSNKTINNHLTMLNTCLNHAVEWGELSQKPRIRKLKVATQKFDFLTVEESRQLTNHAYGQWKDMIIFALKTGMRYGEIRAIEWSDINWESNVITVNKAFYRDILGSTKSNKVRHIPLHNDLRKMLEEKKKTHGFIFAEKDGRYLEENKPRRALKRILNKTDLLKAGSRRIGWHALRHTFASHLAMKGAPLVAIQQLLGHSSIQTTMIYAHLAPSTLTQTISLLDDENFGHNMVTKASNPEKNSCYFPSMESDYAAKIKQKQSLATLLLNSGDGGS